MNTVQGNALRSKPMPKPDRYGARFHTRFHQLRSPAAKNFSYLLNPCSNLSLLGYKTCFIHYAYRCLFD